MAKNSSIRTRCGGGLSVSYDIKDDSRKAVKKLADVLSESTKKLNRYAPKILRKHMYEQAASDRRTAKHAYKLLKLKSENRDIKNPKAGAGLTFRYTGGQMQIRVLLSRKDLGDQAYFALMVAQFGRKQLPIKSEGVYAMAVSYSVWDGRLLKRYNYPESPKPGKFVRFSKGPIPKVDPYNKWMTNAKNNAVKELMKVME